MAQNQITIGIKLDFLSILPINIYIYILHMVADRVLMLPGINLKEYEQKNESDDSKSFQ